MPGRSPILPDARADNWVDRFAPAAARPWLKLGRFDRPTGIWLLMLPAWQGMALNAAERGVWPVLSTLGLFLIGAALMRAAGCAYNDIVDRDLDARVARTAMRPVASGAISVRGAWRFLIACALGGAAILVQLNLMAAFLGVCSLALVAAYPFMKRLTWWPQAWLGLTFNWGVLMGFAAAEVGPDAISTLKLAGRAWAHGVDLALYAPPLPAEAWLLYFSGVAWTLGYDTIYAVQDLEDDALAGVRSSARRLGARAPWAVAAFYAVSVALAASAARLGGLGTPSLLWTGLFALLLAWQAWRLKLDDPRRALGLFKLNTWAGLILFGALLAGRFRGV